MQVEKHRKQRFPSPTPQVEVKGQIRFEQEFDTSRHDVKICLKIGTNVGLALQRSQLTPAH